MTRRKACMEHHVYLFLVLMLQQLKCSEKCWLCCSIIFLYSYQLLMTFLLISSHPHVFMSQPVDQIRWTLIFFSTALILCGKGFHSQLSCNKASSTTVQAHTTDCDCIKMETVSHKLIGFIAYFALTADNFVS